MHMSGPCLLGCFISDLAGLSLEFPSNSSICLFVLNWLDSREGSLRFFLSFFLNFCGFFGFIRP